MTAVALPLGPAMIGIAGTVLDEADRERLLHPVVGGVILFTRNFASKEQLGALCAAIHGLRSPALVIAVDHEGGRVQRFREGFSELPHMRSLGVAWDQDVATAAGEARRIGMLIGSELRACGLDLSFAPVLDLDWGNSEVIGQRALHRNPNAVAHLAAALRAGLNAAGLAACGKHFPGHGFVAADSHTDLPVDERPLEALLSDDLVPFASLVPLGLESMMAAHVVYPAVENLPAGYSRRWCSEILRQRLGFDGLLFSDDLDMAGALTAGDIVARAGAALDAGCDVVLACNDVAGIDELLSRWSPMASDALAQRWALVAGR